MSNTFSLAKEKAGQAALPFITPGMRVGLGTGSTTYYFIEALGEACRKGLNIEAVASSEQSAELARAKNIPLLPQDRVTSLDVTVDGADQIDAQKRMIKGGGGALLREKILASISKEMIVVVDSSKVVETFHDFPLPIEIIPFLHQATIKKINNINLTGKLREKAGIPYVSDNGNYIYDVILPHPCLNPEELNQSIRSIPGVVETGFFFHLAGRVIVGFPTGKVEIHP
ncbi:MAG: ribose 5-phosphate isomerase A [Parachlamydia sp.]|nr:MAG: ribose 5-phosphate isomerase A [Parachlamydia sp.]